jgi:hypothetical protein
MSLMFQHVCSDFVEQHSQWNSIVGRECPNGILTLSLVNDGLSPNPPKRSFRIWSHAHFYQNSIDLGSRELRFLDPDDVHLGVCPWSLLDSDTVIYITDYEITKGNAIKLVLMKGAEVVSAT